MNKEVGRLRHGAPKRLGHLPVFEEAAAIGCDLKAGANLCNLCCVNIWFPFCGSKRGTIFLTSEISFACSITRTLWPPMAQEMAAPSPPRPAPTMIIESWSKSLEPDELETVLPSILPLLVCCELPLSTFFVFWSDVVALVVVEDLVLLLECFRSQLRTAPIFAVIGTWSQVGGAWSASKFLVYLAHGGKTGTECSQIDLGYQDWWSRKSAACVGNLVW